MKAPLMVALAIAMPQSARADEIERMFDNMGFGFQLHYELSSLRAADRMTAAERSHGAEHLVLGGIRSHLFFGGKDVAWHTGLDVAVGSTIGDAGFAYDFAVFPVGVAMRYDETSLVTLGAGIGGSGAVGTINDAVTFPIELRFEAGRGIRLLGRARVSYLEQSDPREDGGMTLSVGDELEAMLGLRLGGKTYHQAKFLSGNGHFLGATVRESAGVRYAGITFGYSIDMSTEREPPPKKRKKRKKLRRVR